ncbi:MAG: peptidoglycan bridge formation glycyltransferase FemA/FemB family protein [Bacilli bacterium]|jgi:peptidoglycan pentaglycine glycine transferase (the second and third glycine)
MKFTILSEDEFRTFAANHPLSNFHQTIEWGLLKEKTGWHMHLVGLKKDNHIIAATMLLSNKILGGLNIFYCPRGFLIDFNDYETLSFFTKELKKYISKNKGIFLKIDPYIIHKERDINGNIIGNGIDNSHIISYLKKLKYRHYGFNIYNETLQPRWLSVLSLENKDEQQILKEMDYQTRQNVNRTLKLALDVEELDYDNIDRYKNIMLHTSQRRHFVDRPLKYYQDMYSILKPKDMIKILIVSLDTDKYLKKLEQQLGEAIQIKNDLENQLAITPNSYKFNNRLKEINTNINNLNTKIKDAIALKNKYGSHIDLAGSMFITYGPEIVYLYSGAYNEFMKFNAQYRLQWEMIKYGLENNFKNYNFYGITGDFSNENEQYGIYAFKKGFNANVVELIGEFDLVINNWYYSLYKFLFWGYKLLKKIIKR